MNFTQFIDKVDNLSTEQINLIYTNTYFIQYTTNTKFQTQYLKHALNNCHTEYEKNKTKLQDLNTYNNDYLLNSFIPSKLMSYITYKENVELENKTKQCEALYNFCLKMCVDMAFN